MKRCLWIILILFTSNLTAKETYLTDRDLRLIRKNWTDYSYASKCVGIPTAVLAAIHYREADLLYGWYSKKKKKVIRNVGGPFMLDLGPLNNPSEFTRRIRRHEKKIHRLYGSGPAPKVSHDFRFAVVVAAHHLKMKTHNPHSTGECTALLTGGDDCLFETEECIAYAVWGYNGRAYWQIDDAGRRTHRASSYVWSDPKNGITLPMRYTEKDGTINTFIDTRPGVMVIYKELKDIFG